MNRNDENALTYDTRNLFNSNLLQQYDSDGQKGFLGYLLRHKNWKIEENKILFPDINTKDEINKLTKEYDLEYIKMNYEIQKQTLKEASIFGINELEEMLKNKYKKMKNFKDKYKDVR